MKDLRSECTERVRSTHRPPRSSINLSQLHKMLFNEVLIISVKRGTLRSERTGRIRPGACAPPQGRKSELSYDEKTDSLTFLAT